MKYIIANESLHWIRIRTARKSLSREEADILSYAFRNVPGVTKVRVYPASGGLGLSYYCDRKDIIRRLDSFRLANVEMMAEEEKRSISAEEMKERKLDPGLKNRLRARILAEAVADALLPVPVQLGFHLYQMVTLRNL